jgi:integrase
VGASTSERRVLAGLSASAIRDGLALACRDAGLARYGPHALRHRRCSLWLAHGFETVFVKRWSGHSKASLLTDVYGHVIVDPAGDEWRAFWLEAYEAAKQPKRPEIASYDAAGRAPRVAPVRPNEAL